MKSFLSRIFAKILGPVVTFLIKRKRHRVALAHARLFLAGFNLHAAVLLGPRVTDEDEVLVRRLLCQAASKLCFPLPLFADPHQVKSLAEDKWPSFLYARDNRQSLVIFLEVTRGRGETLAVRLSLLNRADMERCAHELVHVTASVRKNGKRQSLVSALFQLASKGHNQFRLENAPQMERDLRLYQLGQ